MTRKARNDVTTTSTEQTQGPKPGLGKDSSGSSARDSAAGAGPDARESRGPAAAWLVAAAGMALETLALVVMAGLSAYGVVSGGASTTTRALTEAAVLLVLAIGLGLLASNLLRRRSLAKTPTLLWNAMLVPVAFSLYDGGAPALGVAAGVVAVVTFVSALLVPRYEIEDTDTVL